MMRRREAEGSIYTGKCQGTKQWPMLPHYTSYGLAEVGVLYIMARLEYAEELAQKSSQWENKETY